MSYDVKYSGSIQGTVSVPEALTLTVDGLTDVQPDVQVSAETVSSDGTRHIIVKTTRVDSSGNFALYPLSTASGAPGNYDLVIHGPNIETVIIKSVPVVAGAPGTASAQFGDVGPGRGKSLPGQFQHQLAGGSDQLTGGFLPDPAFVLGSALSG